MNSQITSNDDDVIAASKVWAYMLPSFVLVAGAIFVSQLDYGTREQVLVSAVYFLVPVCIALGLLGRYTTRIGLLLVATTFCSGLLYSGDMGGGWSHGVAGGFTTANAIVSGIVLLFTSTVRNRLLRSRGIATDHKRSGEPNDATER